MSNDSPNATRPLYLLYQEQHSRDFSLYVKQIVEYGKSHGADLMALHWNTSLFVIFFAFAMEYHGYIPMDQQNNLVLGNAVVNAVNGPASIGRKFDFDVTGRVLGIYNSLLEHHLQHRGDYRNAAEALTAALRFLFSDGDGQWESLTKEIGNTFAADQARRGYPQYFEERMNDIAADQKLGTSKTRFTQWDDLTAYMIEKRKRFETA